MNAVTKDEVQVLELEPQQAARVPVAQQTGALVASDKKDPAALMMSMLTQGATIDQIERIMDLRDREFKFQAEQAFNDDFAKFKSEAIQVIKRKRVHFTSQKGTTDYKHAELSDVVDAVTPYLSKYGFGHSWRVTKQERNWIEVTCTLKHRLGHFETAVLGGPPDESGLKNPIQAIKSAQTYLERATLEAICGVAEKGEDDDGRGGPSPKQPNEPSPGIEEALEAGQAAAMSGMKSLTGWWASLTAKQRSELQKSYPALRRAAEAADKEPRNA